MTDPICPERGTPQSECPPFCPHDFGHLEAYVAEYVNDSPAALRVRITEAQWNALEMARKADQAERRAEETEFHVEQLRDARDRAEAELERLKSAIEGVGHQGRCPVFPCNCWVRDLLPFMEDAALDECSGPCGEHHWLDRPESDTRECLICGTEVAG